MSSPRRGGGRLHDVWNGGAHVKYFFTDPQIFENIQGPRSGQLVLAKIYGDYNMVLAQVGRYYIVINIYFD